MIALEFSTFLGRFHPIVVHLPIGFLVLAILLEWYENFKKPGTNSRLISYAWLLGGITAAVAALCGWFLGETGLYKEQNLFLHRWLGIALVAVVFVGWWIKSNPDKYAKWVRNGINFLLLAMLLVEGHKGGNLTHGDTYLTEYAPEAIQNLLGDHNNQDSIPALGSPDSVVAYRDLIRPILAKKCFSCHNGEVQRGGLNMASLEAFEEGGEGGSILAVGNPMESELFKRITLPQRSSKFMPPTGEVLTYDELKTVEWWIEQGGSFSERVSAMVVNENMKPVLMRRFGLDTEPKPWYMRVMLAPLDSTRLVALQTNGFTVRTLGADNVLLDIKYSGDKLTYEQLLKLEKVKEYVTWLSLAGSDVEDEWLELLGGFSNLTRLQLEKTSITDKGVALLTSLEHLEALNLYGTKVTDACLVDIQKISGLKRVYLWATKVDSKAAKNLEDGKDGLEVIIGEGP